MGIFAFFFPVYFSVMCINNKLPHPHFFFWQKKEVPGELKMKKMWKITDYGQFTTEYVQLNPIL